MISLIAKQNRATVTRFLRNNIVVTWHDLPKVVIKKKLPFWKFPNKIDQNGKFAEFRGKGVNERIINT